MDNDNYKVPDGNQNAAPGAQGFSQGQPGAPQGQPAYGQNPGYPPQYNAPVYQNKYDEVPMEIRKWNWGAFMFNIFWGLGNHAYLTLLMLVPCLNIVWLFVCGAMGNQWAWKSGEFKDVEQFMAVQRTWNRAGLIYFIITIIGVVISIAFSIIFATQLAMYSNQIDWVSVFENM